MQPDTPPTPPRPAPPRPAPPAHAGAGPNAAPAAGLWLAPHADPARHEAAVVADVVKPTQRVLEQLGLRPPLWFAEGPLRGQIVRLGFKPNGTRKRESVLPARECTSGRGLLCSPPAPPPLA